jgi:hypothetical protein
MILMQISLQDQLDICSCGALRNSEVRIKSIRSYGIAITNEGIEGSLWAIL